MKKKTIGLLIITIIVLAVFPLIPHAKAQSEPTLSLTPSTIQVTQLGQTFALNITISNVQDLWFWYASVTWDPTVLNMTGTPQEGNFMTQSGSTLFIVAPPKNGTVPGGIDDTLLTTDGASGSGVLATLTFQAMAQSTSTTIQLNNITLESPPTTMGATGGPQITPTSTSSSTSISFDLGAPAANAGPAQTVKQGTTVTFGGSKSISTGSNPTYAWAFTDNGVNQALTGVNPTYTFNNPGIYTVTLTLTDSNGASTSTVTITVQSNNKPVAVIVVEGISTGQSVAAGQPITFNGTESYETNGTIVSYLWNLGDTTQGTNATITHAYTISTTLKSEIYNVTLTVFDATNQNDTATTSITVVPGSGQTPSPPPSTTPTSTDSSTTPTPNPTSSSETNSTPTPASNDNPQAGLPSYVLVILVIITIAVFGGSTLWLRKRT